MATLPVQPAASAEAEDEALLTIVGIEIPVDDLLDNLLRLDAKRRVSILDSSGAGRDGARYLVAGFDPFETVEAYNDELHIRRCNEATTSIERGSVLSFLDARVQKYKSSHASSARRRSPLTPLASGACIATFSYDLVRCFERLRSAAPPATQDEPDAVLAFYDTLLIHDYAQNRTQIISSGGRERVEQMLSSMSGTPNRAIIKGGKEKPSTSTASGAPDLHASRQIAVSNFTPDEYMAAVERTREHIYAGDIYQANVTQQFTCHLDPKSEPKDIFLRLRRWHPAPFAAFIRRSEDTVISASPERFLRVEAVDGQRTVEAWPIKGTRARGADEEEDARLSAELQTSEKDRAENVMIVDLLRNDLGRVCRYGSVEVTALCQLEQHPTLFHLVSKVRGRLRDDVTVGELLRATFPCGSITGAPKIRAMEIIDEVETVRRGLSMGAIGYFSFDGALDLNVAIRTMVVRNGVARFNVGSGITAGSSLELEYEETLTKARALLSALRAGTK